MLLHYLVYVYLFTSFPLLLQLRTRCGLPARRRTPGRRPREVDTLLRPTNTVVPSDDVGSPGSQTFYGQVAETGRDNRPHDVKPASTTPINRVY